MFQLRKRGIPEFQVQDFTFPRKQLVMDVQPRHGAQMAADNRVRDNLRHFRVFAAGFLDGLQRYCAPLGRARLVFREIGCSLGV